MWQHKARKPKNIPTTEKNKLKAQTNLAKPWMRETQAKMDDPGPQGPFHMYLQAQVRHALTIQETEHMVQGLRLQTSFFQMYCDGHICVTRAKHTWQCNVIQEETKRTEEKEEAEYRSPTWSIKTSTAKDQQSQETWRRGDNVGPFVVSFGCQVLGRGWRTYHCSTGKFIGIRAGAVVEKDRQAEELGGLVQVEEKRRRAMPVWSRWKRNLVMT